MWSVIPNRSLRRKLHWLQRQDSAPHRSVSYGGSSASGARPSATASTDQNTSTSDVTRASSKDHSDGDVAMEGDAPDESSAGRPNRRDQTAEGGSQRKENHVKSDMSNRAPLNSTFRKNLGEDDATRTRSLCHHARGIGRKPRENDEDRERREQHIELGVDFVGRRSRHAAL